jgi:hypothetical protein
MRRARALSPQPPLSQVAANILCRDLCRDQEAVARWIDGGATDGFIKRLIAAADWQLLRRAERPFASAIGRCKLSRNNWFERDLVRKSLQLFGLTL